MLTLLSCLTFFLIKFSCLYIPLWRICYGAMFSNKRKRELDMEFPQVQRQTKRSKILLILLKLERVHLTVKIWFPRSNNAQSSMHTFTILNSPYICNWIIEETIPTYREKTRCMTEASLKWNLRASFFFIFYFSFWETILGQV